MQNSLTQFELLYRQYYRALHYFCKQFVHSDDDAQEIVNDTFVAIWEKRDVLTLDLQLKPYLYKAVRNKSLNFLQKRKLEIQEVESIENLSHKAYSNPFEILYTKETEKLVLELIEKLPPRCKQVFVLSRKEGFSYKDISDIMDISPKTVENQISIAIKQIKEGIEKRHKTIDKNNGAIPLWTLISLALDHIY
ncbi:MAG: RNA polymerase sigma-70 factor [Bacteroidia bacterium]|nr:RNA polymerase sigma-70 factor [Bacteroidota bacterium]MCZ2131085.1 RNA polymerase sigma-70 factor [Bacteroidia bacterium]